MKMAIDSCQDDAVAPTRSALRINPERKIQRRQVARIRTYEGRLTYERHPDGWIAVDRSLVLILSNLVH